MQKLIRVESSALISLAWCLERAEGMVGVCAAVIRTYFHTPTGNSNLLITLIVSAETA